MDNTKKITIRQNLKTEIEKIDKKQNNIYFFVLDTKGTPSGSLKYIYNLALILKEDGYSVSMLHSEEEFIGVKSWLGEQYASLPHYNINKDKINMFASDLLFIPEIYSQVMNQTRNLPCKRIAILQNYDYLVEQMPYTAQWGTFGIMDAITNSDYQKEKLHKIFPYVKTTRIEPFISNEFVATTKPKNMIINIVSKYPNDVPQIVKPFYWKYPMFKWVSFKDIRGLSTEEFAKAVKEAAVTIVVDDTMSFGYAALESMASDTLTMVKIPTTHVDWMENDKGSLSNGCVWFNDYDTLHSQLATVVRSWITDNMPSVFTEEAVKIRDKYTRDNTKKQILDYVLNILSNRKEEMVKLLNQISSQDNKKD